MTSRTSTITRPVSAAMCIMPQSLWSLASKSRSCICLDLVAANCRNRAARLRLRPCTAWSMRAHTEAMSRKWTHDGDDMKELSNGTVRIAYDADTQLYTWRRPDGVTLEGPELPDVEPMRLKTGQKTASSNVIMTSRVCWQSASTLVIEPN
ncbi:hypothetical protein CONLIGDRAFT_701498 [Coniochaeta ligniaria NRRL 30616]|uniref:Uncharacterized protein n=1 Tax=Coniochaeta ligniaria NRRL 30616 TaxID=1408157 RepID=A0A1J7IPK6_9PEZI|nr:hypothetical protein CONLIGDRAFT_701498 [Coniochaeta ligniaria NRRL 30616]